MSLYLLPLISRQPPRPWCTCCLPGGTLSSSAPPQASVNEGLAAAVEEPNPPSSLHTWPCSTTSLWGLQQQPSPDSRGVGDIKGEQQARGQLVVCKCHHMDIYRNAARGEIAGSAPILSKQLQQREKKPWEQPQSLSPGAGQGVLCWARPNPLLGAASRQLWRVGDKLALLSWIIQSAFTME